MSGESRLLVTDALVEFEEQPAELQGFRRTTNHFRGIYGNMPQINEEKLKDHNM